MTIKRRHTFDRHRISFDEYVVYVLRRVINLPMPSETPVSSEIFTTADFFCHIIDEQQTVKERNKYIRWEIFSSVWLFVEEYINTLDVGYLPRVDFVCDHDSRGRSGLIDQIDMNFRIVFLDSTVDTKSFDEFPRDRSSTKEESIDCSMFFFLAL